MIWLTDDVLVTTDCDFSVHISQVMSKKTISYPVSRIYYNLLHNIVFNKISLTCQTNRQTVLCFMIHYDFNASISSEVMSNSVKRLVKFNILDIVLSVLQSFLDNSCDIYYEFTEICFTDDMLLAICCDFNVHIKCDLPSAQAYTR